MAKSTASVKSTIRGGNNKAPGIAPKTPSKSTKAKSTAKAKTTIRGGNKKAAAISPRKTRSSKTFSDSSVATEPRSNKKKARASSKVANKETRLARRRRGTGSQE